MDDDLVTRRGNLDLPLALGARPSLAAVLVADFEPGVATRADDVDGHGLMLAARCWNLNAQYPASNIEQPASRASLTLLEIVLVDRHETLVGQGVERDLDVVHHQRHNRSAAGTRQQRIDLRNVHLGLQ